MTFSYLGFLFPKPEPEFGLRKKQIQDRPTNGDELLQLKKEKTLPNPGRALGVSERLTREASLTGRARELIWICPYPKVETEKAGPSSKVFCLATETTRKVSFLFFLKEE